MGIFTEEVPKTSVTLYIERLSNYEEIEWYQFQQLTESIFMQESGSREAIEAIRKRLKHGTTQQKLRVLEVLKLLMENSNQRFHRQLMSNEKMKERFELMVTSPMEAIEVRKTLVGLLGAWSQKYKGEPGMHILGDIYEMGMSKLGYSTKRSTAMRSRPKSPTKEERRRSMPPPAKPVKPIETKVKNKPRSQSNATNASSSGSGQRVFNFETAKPKIINEVALANQNTNNLVNALKLINTREDRWEIDLQHDARVQDLRQKCEESKRKIVRYARLVEDEEWIGTLLATNEELLRALDMYDVMSVGEVPVNMPTSPVAPTSLPSPMSPTQHMRSPPPPPPLSSSQFRQTQDSPLQQFSSLSVSDRQDSVDSDDPFADPVQPLEDDFPNDRQRKGEYVL
ncbi:uncharacterized protein BYT42DRAFT_241507 [Radiomyces spectabilis]|uniref:uncharacterized protein n=1 Tax=Radiomyces spectabilis TaxID=64574 RepID=UPI00222030A4|nr:uncharacterized protein BYT42DRAFT_241507 [Radiomyces spectabilis]KAI8388627.1 hypothetical protein BYT42DRAFT_241507 [Radiomyces spectabilis]